MRKRERERKSNLKKSSSVGIVMRWRKLLFLLFLIAILIIFVDAKGGRGGGGGFKLFGMKKSSIAARNAAKVKQQQKVALKASKASASENEITKNNKYFNRDRPISSADYGMIFATQGLSRNSYIYNNYYRTQSRRAGIAQFLTNALFFRAGMRMGRGVSQYDEWNEEDDKRWRLTTKAPYFENKIPGENFLKIKKKIV